MATDDSVNEAEFRRTLLGINIWSLTLVMALVLERLARALAEVTKATDVDGDVWGALGVMGIVFGVVLATAVGISALHVKFSVPYGYVQVLWDNVLIAAPLYIAVRFIDVTGTADGDGSVSVAFDSTTFRWGAGLIAVAFAMLLVRDVLTLPQIANKYGYLPLFVVGAIHFGGFVLAFVTAVWPDLVTIVVVAGGIGLMLFFAGMAFLNAILERITEHQVAATAAGA